MPTPTIPAGNLYMNATLYTGTGATLTVTNGVAGQAFQPDLVWMKSRGNNYNHTLYDSVRGTGTGKALYSNDTSAEGADTTLQNLTAFNSNGFSLGSTSSTNIINNSGGSFVAWNFKAGGAATTITVGQYSISPNVPSIASSVSANTTSGFSVATFTTQASGTGTFGHGLGVAPSMVIAKARGTVSNWNVYHSSVGNTGALLLNSTAATATSINYWNNTSPTPTVVTIGSGFAGTLTYVAYCWTPIAGYSAFGSYTGNGSTDGPFIYLGFRPRWIMIKRTDVVESWYIYDTSTTAYNAMTQYLVANSSAAEATFTFGDYLSNGFKVRNTAAGLNASSGTYIYAAFAENPFKYANAR